MVYGDREKERKHNGKYNRNGFWTIRRPRA